MRPDRVYRRAAAGEKAESRRAKRGEAAGEGSAQGGRGFGRVEDRVCDATLVFDG